MSTNENSTEEKPQNGRAGLKHWRHDLMAGLMVSLTSLPLSLGIAVASGAPPIAGLISAIIAGLILPFLGGSFVTISGPAAGLAPALLAAMTLLGHGDTADGYPKLLAVIAVVGVAQIGLSLLGAARLSAAFPTAVVEGMLAAIGFMIMAKELPHFLGHAFHSHNFFGILIETPEELAQMQPRVTAVGAVCLALLFGLSRIKTGWLKKIPAPLLAVVVGTILGRLLGLKGAALIHIPDDFLNHGIVVPDFPSLIADRSLWTTAVISMVTLVLIDGVESLATIAAVDRIDPFKRKSSPDRTLLAMGVSNIASSLAGGLTIIPGGVKSKVCVVSGGRTLWANFYNACFLISFLFIARPLINAIPYASLAAILIYTGYRMCEPVIWRHIAHVGRPQLALFAITVVVTLATDLLWGIAAGMAAKLLWNGFLTARHAHRAEPRGARRGLPAFVAGFFTNPASERGMAEGRYSLKFNKPLTCFSVPHILRELRSIPADASTVVLELGEGVTLIDHTACDTLLHFAEEFGRSGRGRAEIVGFDRFVSTGHAPASVRLAPLPGAAATAH